jgi:hypothetical protein
MRSNIKAPRKKYARGRQTLADKEIGDQLVRPSTVKKKNDGQMNYGNYIPNSSGLH